MIRTVQSAGFILFLKQDNKNLFLLLQYRGGHWYFPKGKIDPHETKEEAAVRELKEETGLEATILPGFQESFSYTFTDYDHQKTHKTVFFFIAQTTSKTIQLSDEHIASAWL